MTKNVLHLICHPAWMRDELAGNTLYELDHSLGLSVPAYSKGDIWWLPQAQAVQLLNSVRAHHLTPGVVFTAPHPGQLSSLDFEHVGRHTGVVTAEEAVSVLFDWPDQFWKMATAKSDKFLAEIRTHDQMVEAVSEAQLPSESLLEWSEILPNIRKEFRTFVYDSQDGFEVAGVSVYLEALADGMRTVYDGAETSSDELDAVKNFVSSVLENKTTEELPPAFVLDVTVLSDGRMIVLEFNPVWCSAWYDVPVDAVVTAIERGFQGSVSERKKWMYVPDPLLTNKYKQIWPVK